MTKITSRITFAILTVLTMFIALNFKENLGLLFGLMAIAAIVGISLFDKKIKYPIQQTNSKITKTVIIASLTYIAFIITSAPIITALNQIGILKSTLLTTPNSILEVLAQTQQSLAFEGSKILNFIAFGFVVAIIETLFFFGFLYEVLIDQFNALGKLTDLKTIGAIIITATAFTVFHASSKGVENDTALTLVFLFAVASLILVTITKQLLDATLLHINSNTIALLVQQGILGLPQIIGLTGIIIALSYVILERVKISKLTSLRS